MISSCGIYLPATVQKLINKEADNDKLSWDVATFLYIDNNDSILKVKPKQLVKLVDLCKENTTFCSKLWSFLREQPALDEKTTSKDVYKNLAYLSRVASFDSEEQVEWVKLAQDSKEIPRTEIAKPMCAFFKATARTVMDRCEDITKLFAAALNFSYCAIKHFIRETYRENIHLFKTKKLEEKETVIV